MSSLWTITDPASTVELEDRPPALPLTAGEMLKELFMDEMNLSVADVAGASGLDAERIQRLLDGGCPTGEDSLRLDHVFGQRQGFFLSIHQEYELEAARRRVSGQLTDLPALAAA